ncbi:hypothetical protein FZEAL_767 [Fusarium zealandicum]|uniref:Alcohol dehydrogenase iron-type/glycerol dehydrogenase GldA domain-containing protein n=1 Tax=Fusarium zealandicum TaxID=1053134 RepID=A0A8H4UUA7_9HYPO|nr:hypothetical protein FZEAL_767 [Fusarium zealandicum]
MTLSTSALRRLPPLTVADSDLIALRTRLLNALAVKASALVTPPATNVSPLSSHTAPTGPARSRPRQRRMNHKSQGSTPRVVFGPGAVNRLPAELARLHLSSPLIVSSPSRLSLARKIQAIITNLNSRMLISDVIAVPARISGRDCVVSVGGGSAVTLARAVSSRKGIPHICIPTTYSGSEVTAANIGSGSSHRSAGGATRTSKQIAKESKIPPSVVIYDEDLTMTSRFRFSAPSHQDVMEDFHRTQHAPKTEDACWSYLRIPGV